MRQEKAALLVFLFLFILLSLSRHLFHHRVHSPSHHHILIRFVLSSPCSNHQLSFPITYSLIFTLPSDLSTLTLSHHPSLCPCHRQHDNVIFFHSLLSPSHFFCKHESLFDSHHSSYRLVVIMFGCVGPVTIQPWQSETHCRRHWQPSFASYDS
jgi:hypothetical protein